MIPFTILQVIERDSDYVLPCLLVSQVGQVFFMVVEYINFTEDGSKEYFNDTSNYSDLS